MFRNALLSRVFVLRMDRRRRGRKVKRRSERQMNNVGRNVTACSRKIQCCCSRGIPSKDRREDKESEIRDN